MTFKGTTALITGASVGLGAEFARQLAAGGANLVLVARSADKLNSLADELRQHARVVVDVLPADLSSADAVQALIAEVRDRGLNVDLLVNNAGLGVFEDFLGTPFGRQLEQVDVNVQALVTLTHAFTPAMVAARRGGVINLASTAAFQPLAGAAIYAASKAFVLFFSEALAQELAKSDVTVLASCPGPVATRFFAAMNPKLKAAQMDQPGTVVRHTLEAFQKGKKVVYPGKLQHRLGTWGARFLPRNLMVRLAANTISDLNQR